MIWWLACNGHPATETPVAATVAPTPIAASMPPHAAEAMAGRDALVFGDVVGFRDRMAALDRRLPLDGIDDRVQVPFAAAVHHATTVPDLAAAGAALGRVTRTCAECHTLLGVVVHTRVPPTAEGDGVRAEMERHDRALGLIWDGLVRPDEQDLHRGAEAFRTSYLSPVNGSVSPVAAALDDEVTATAARIAAAQDPQRKSEQFGTLLTLCVSCHSARPGGLTLEPD